MDQSKQRLLSIVIPVYNEEACLRTLHQELLNALNPLHLRHEIIFVDDGSTDQSIQVIRELQQKDPQITAVSLSRNFGHQIALTAGLDYCRGDAVITMDADLQHPPRIIPQLVHEWESGAQVVHTIRDRTEGIGWLKDQSSKLYYRLIQKFSTIKIKPNIADFRLLDRQVIESLKAMKEHHRFLRGMIEWLGYRQALIHFTAERRAGGRSKYSWHKMFQLGLDGIISFSSKPLGIALWLGVGVLILNVIYAVYILHTYIYHKELIRGWTSLILLMMFLSSIQLILLGVMGEYVGRIYDELKGRPLYRIRQVLGPSSGPASRS